MRSFDQLADPPKKGKVIKSAYESESFESDGTIHVDGLVGSATISPAGRDVALASVTVVPLQTSTGLLTILTSYRPAQ
ncbi:hypothetical protein IL306_009315 [Fusarium sp. DS 682]|nr:hypothetical protein IL306_009315 [Fusarium sp. DS 682]